MCNAVDLAHVFADIFYGMGAIPMQRGAAR
jgi:hypothetical protein